jgi:hypothetical protein
MKKYFLLLFAVLLLGSCNKNLHIATTKKIIYTPQKQDFPVLALQPKTAISPVFVQTLPTSKIVLSSQNIYEQAFYQIRQLLQGGKPLSFKKAVYLTENAYFDNELPENSFNQAITDLVSLTKAVGKTSKFSYKYADSVNLRKNYAIYRVLADMLNIANIFQLLPYEYDFEDSRGEKEWAKGFVTKLLATRAGNCHSLPFLYKILAEELETEAYLSLLPHHIYLQIPFKRPPYGTQTYFNTELTSKTFPLDAWVETAGYVSNAAVVSGMYMDRLDTKQSIALCLVDLAKGFEARNKEKLSAAEIDQFMQNCIDLALQVAPNLITARLLQVEIESRKVKNLSNYKNFPSFKNLESLVTQLFADGYLELPELMYSEQPKTAGLDSTYTPFAQENIREGTPTGKGTVLTLSNGRYAEFKNAKKIETIGSVKFDTEKHKIVGFGENKRQVEVVSRFLSVDPIAKQYPELTPYQFASNTPIQAIDLDGLERLDVTKQYEVGVLQTNITVRVQQGSVPAAAVAGINNQPPLNTITAVQLNLFLGRYRISFSMTGGTAQNFGGDAASQTLYTQNFRYDPSLTDNGVNAPLIPSRTTRGNVNQTAGTMLDANNRRFFGGYTYGRAVTEPNANPQNSTIGFQGGSSEFTDRDATYNSLMPQMVYDFRNPNPTNITINVMYPNNTNLDATFFSHSLGTNTTMREILTNRGNKIAEVFRDVRTTNGMPSSNININLVPTNNQNQNNTATVATQ